MNSQPIAVPQRPQNLRSTSSSSVPKMADGHRRQTSVASQHSIASAPADMDAFIARMATSPVGSKMQEDARKAMRLAERSRNQSRRGSDRSLRPDRPERPPDQPRSARSSFGSSAEGVGRAMLAPSTDEDNESSFEYDDQSESSFGDFISGYQQMHVTSPPDWPGPPAYPAPDVPLPPVPQGMTPYADPDMLLNGNVAGNVPTSLLRNRSQLVRPKTNVFGGVPAHQNAVAIFWRGERPQTFSLVTRGVGQHGQDDTFPIEVAAKHTQVIEMPDVWKGWVQKQARRHTDPATRAHVEFGGYRGLNYFAVDYSNGNDGPVVVRTSPSGEQAGSPFRAAQVSPPLITVTTPDGQRVVLGTRQVTNQQRLTVAKFYREFFDHAEQGGIMPEDDAAYVPTRDRHLHLDFY